VLPQSPPPRCAYGQQSLPRPLFEEKVLFLVKVALLGVCVPSTELHIFFGTDAPSQPLGSSCCSATRENSNYWLEMSAPLDARCRRA